MSEAPRELWRHPKPTETQIWAFKEGVNRKYALQLETYDDLYHWSIENITHFWEETWHFTGIKASKTYNKTSLVPECPEFLSVTAGWASGDKMAFSKTGLNAALAAGVGFSTTSLHCFALVAVLVAVQISLLYIYIMPTKRPARP